MPSHSPKMLFLRVALENLTNKSPLKRFTEKRLLPKF